MSKQTQNYQHLKLHKVLAVLMVGVLLLLAVTFVSRLDETKPVEAQSTTQASIASSVDLQRIFKVNVPAFFKELVTMTALEVEGESIFGGEVAFENDVVFDGQITLNGDVFGTGVNIDIGSGELTASNVIYSLEAGSGISISEGQNPTISATDLGSAQNIFKKVKIGSDTLESDENSDTLEFAAGSGIALSTDTGSDKITITNSSLPGFVKSGTYAILESGVTRVGIGTSTPGNTVEIKSESTGTSGLTFTNLTSASSVGIGGGKVLSVDSGGNVILVTDESGGVAEGDLDSALPGASAGSTIYHDGTTWAHTTNLYHNGGQVGVSTIPGTNIRVDVKTNATSAVGMVIRRVSGQTADLLQLRNESDSVLSYFDADGVFHGSISGSGSFDPGFTTGSVLFQGASGLTQDNANFFWDDTNNRLGIGTSSPAAALNVVGTGSPLLVNGTGQITAVVRSSDNHAVLSLTSDTGKQWGLYSLSGTSDFKIRNVTDGTDLLYIQDTGNIGIGTTSPSAKFDVRNGNIVLTDDDVVHGMTTLGTTNSFGVLQQFEDPFGGLHVLGMTDANTRALVLEGVHGSGSSPTVPAILIRGAKKSGTGKTDWDTTAPILQIANNSTNLMTVLGGGNVGIGTVTPLAKLDVAGGTLSSTIPFALRSTATVNSTQRIGNVLFVTGHTTSGARQAGVDITLWDGNSGIEAAMGLQVGTNSQGGSTSQVIGFGGIDNQRGGMGIYSIASGSGAVNYGLKARAINAYNTNIGVYGNAAPSTGGNGLGVVGAAFGSSDVRLGGYFWTNSTTSIDPTLVSGALVANNGDTTVDILRAEDNGSTVLVVKDGGNVGIGDSTPTEGKLTLNHASGVGIHSTNSSTGIGLHLVNTADDGDVRMALDVNGGAVWNIGVNDGDSDKFMIGNHGGGTLDSNVRLAIDTNGNVGIGTTSPGALLHVGSTAPTSRYTQIDTNGILTARRDENTAGVVYPIIMENRDGTASIAHNQALRFNFGSTGDTTAIEGARIQIGKELEWTGTGSTRDSFMAMYTTLNGTAGEKMRVASSGNVGIGTTDPTAKLTIGADSGYNGTFHVGTVGANANRIAKMGNVFEFTTGAGPTWTGQGIRVDGTNRAINLVGSASNVTDDTVFSMDVGGTSSLFNGPTSGNKTLTVTGTNANFTPTSGTATYTVLDIRSTINQTGGASGVTRGLYINPTLTAAADWRGIEIANNSGYGIYQSGASAKNYFAGNVGIGTTNPGAKLEVQGTGASSTALIIKGGASQSGDFLQITDSTGSLEYFSIDPTVGAVFNEVGAASADFRVEGDSNANLLFVDASADRVGIGTNLPLSTLNINGGVGSLATGLTFGDGDTGIFENIDDQLYFDLGGTTQMRLVANELRSHTTNGATVRWAVGSSTFASFAFVGDAGTGMFRAAASTLGFSTGTVERVRIDSAGNVGINTTTFGTNAARVLAIAGSTAPTTSITDGIQLFAVDAAGSHELQVMDEAGNTTTLSPHNFSLTGGRSEDLAWSFYSERNSLAINADMTKALRVVEKLSGEKLVYLKDLSTGEMLEDESDATQVAALAEQGEISTVAKWNYQLWTFLGEVIFEKPVQFLAGITVNGRAVFASDTWFGGRTTFADKDMAGYAEIPEGGEEVEVKFSKPYATKPIVTVSLEGTVVPYSLESVSEAGFTLKLVEATDVKVRFNWIALYVEGAELTVGEVAGTQVEETEATPTSSSSEPSPIPITTPSINPEATPTATPEATPLPEATTSATTSPQASESATLN